MSLILAIIILLAYDHSIPPTALHYATRYDRIALAFDAKGYNAQTIPELDEALHSAFHIKRQSPVIINVVLSPTSARKAQVSTSTFIWVMGIRENAFFVHRNILGSQDQTCEQ